MNKIFKIFALSVFLLSSAWAKVYTVGIDYYPPINYTDEKGNPTGYEIELLEALSKEIGFKYKIESMKFSELPAAIVSGKVDFAIAFITITDSRKAWLDFTEPYFDAKMIAYKRTYDKSITKMSDLSGKTIAVVTDSSTAVNIAKSIPDANILITHNNLARAVEALKTKKADALIIESVHTPAVIYNKYLGHKQKDISIMEKYKNIELKKIESFDDDGEAIAFKKGENEELRKKMSEAIAKFKADGTLQRLAFKYIVVGH
ncbi:substrate-binding periplasmic protein [Campylobacter geochelonis]|uniref:substrate-binding periplasmic protein n=1 Tax=Campylobacter geochelonis TaxID=1780362 RepID=UPI000770A77C|nr:ABC transporter substrate-binding protein [Campylobacter geochelonis]CZE46623.1 CjaC [Campylobacter geochelonis]